MLSTRPTQDPSGIGRGKVGIVLSIWFSSLDSEDAPSVRVTA
jgi:hypothetical protein